MNSPSALDTKLDRLGIKVFDPVDYMTTREDIAAALELAFDSDGTVDELRAAIADCWQAYCRHIDPDAAARHPELAPALVPGAAVDLALLLPFIQATGLYVKVLESRTEAEAVAAE